MRKKLDTRFPAVRIKKIMQADEDVGKIAMAVPILVSKALELFLQDLCDRTYDITVQRGAKTVNSLHLKNCVHSYNVFDFLKEVVSKVPDYGSPDATGDTKRRKVAANESNESDDESKRNYVKSQDVLQQETVHANSSCSGRGRGRGRGRGPGRPRATDREPPRVDVGSSLVDSQQSSKQVSSPVRPAGNNSELKESVTENIKATDGVGPDSRNFDLNAGVDEVSDKSAPIAPAAAPTSSSAGPSDLKRDEYPVLSEMDRMRMAIDPVHLTQLSSKLDEEDEDYDEEG